MMYVSLSLRYHRQLNLIAHDVVESFFKEAAAVAGANGGVLLPQGSSAVYAFDSNDLCCAFSVFIALEAILKLAEERKERVKEYFIFVDTSEKEISSDEIEDRMSACDNIILPDRVAVLTENAAALLSPYVAFEPLEASSLFRFAGRKPIGKKETIATGFLSRPILLPFLGIENTGRAGLLSAFLNTASGIAMDFEPMSFLTKKEAAMFAEDKKAVARFAASRFAAAHPSYIMDACEEYLKLFFTALSRFYAETRGGEAVEIEIPQVPFPEKEISRFEALLSDICVFKRQSGDELEPSAGAIDGAAIPPDIMDAAYLLFRASTFIYAGETEPLLHFLGKGRYFRDAMDSWLYASGFSRGNSFFRRARYLSEIGFPPETNKKRLDKYLFDYLLNKSKTGGIRPDKVFCARLASLGVKPPDSLLAAAAYLSANPAQAAEELKGRFSDKSIAAAIEDHAEAEKKLSRGDFRAAQVDAKRALHVFQRSRILSGEFETFSFLARVLFSREDSSSGDAFSYLNYALENSVKMRDAEAQKRTLFDFAAMRFLSGNLSDAQADARRLRERAAACYDKSWEIAARFVEGRILFALGDYRACENVFVSLASECPKIGIKKAAPLCAAWALRARACQTKKTAVLESLLELCAVIPEAALFALEGIAIAHEEGKAGQEAESLFLRLPEKIENIQPEGIYLSPAEWSWRSSFALAEDRYFRGQRTGAAGILYAAFHAFDSALLGKDASALASAKESIASLARSNMPLVSPRAYMLYCLCFDLERRISCKDSPDSLSFLSRAFKGAQTLANNITDSAMREKFLTEPYWNAMLYTAAREGNLI